MPQPRLSTPRLDLVPLADEHLPLEIALDADAEVLRYLFPGARSPEQVAERHTGRLAEGRLVDGLGMWMGFLGARPPDAEAFVGLFMLTPVTGPAGDAPRTDLAELGYRIRRDRWRQGFASEGGRALLRHGFDTLGLTRVVAQTMAVNVGSRATMATLGLTYERSFTAAYDEPVAGHEQGEVEYAISRGQWRERERTRRS